MLKHPPPMAVLTIRNLDDSVRDKLRVRAALNGRSMEAEARAILAETVTKPGDHEVNLAEAIRARFADIGGVDLDEAASMPFRDPPRFK